MKKFAAFLLAVILLFSLGSAAFAVGSVRATRAAQRLSVDGRYMACDIYSVFQNDSANGNNYFKLRDIAYMLNGTGSQFSVGYDNATNTISITTGRPYVTDGSEMLIAEDRSATVQPCAQSLIIDGVVRSDLTAYTFSAANGYGNNFFKLRDLGSALGFDVDYDGATATMLVNSRGTAPEAKELNAEEIYAKCVPSVFYIEVFDDAGGLLCTGSGFFIDGIGTAVTNHHVIKGGTSAKVYRSDAAGNSTVCDVLGVYDYNEHEDWAVLKVSGSSFSYLKFGSPATAVGGATVYALGSPLGLDDSLSQGLISNPARQVDDQVYIQTSAPISPGSSGGALINKYGEVIGITSAGFDEGQNLNLAIPIGKLSAISTTTCVPISETYTISTGSLEVEHYYVGLKPNGSFRNLVTAVEYDCTEDTTVEYEIEDEGLISCEWGEWNGNTIPLNIFSGGSYGSTYVWLYYYTDSGTPLAGDYFLVEVCGGYLAPANVEDYDLSVSLGKTKTVTLTGYSFDNTDVYVHAYACDGGIVSFSFGDWAGDSLPLQITGIGAGETCINLELKDSVTDKVLTSDWLNVTVS